MVVKEDRIFRDEIPSGLCGFLHVTPYLLTLVRGLLAGNGSSALSVVRKDRRKLAFFEDLPCECRHWAEYFTCLITLNPQRSHEMATIIPIS